MSVWNTLYNKHLAKAAVWTLRHLAKDNQTVPVRLWRHKATAKSSVTSLPAMWDYQRSTWLTLGRDECSSLFNRGEVYFEWLSFRWVMTCMRQYHSPPLLMVHCEIYWHLMVGKHHGNHINVGSLYTCLVCAVSIMTNIQYIYQTIP